MSIDDDEDQFFRDDDGVGVILWGVGLVAAGLIAAGLWGAAQLVFG